MRAAAGVGAFALSTVAIAPALAATTLAQAGANAVTLTVAGNGAGTGDFVARHDGTEETTTGKSRPDIAVLVGQQVLNAGVLAQEATATVRSGGGYSAACAGLAGNGGSVAQAGDSACLSPGTPVSATLGSLDLSNMVIADPETALGGLNAVGDPLIAQLAPIVNQVVAGAAEHFGDMGLIAGFGAVEGRCEARPGAADGSATLVDASIRVQAPGHDVTLLKLPVNPPPNTHVTTNLSVLIGSILDAVRTDLDTSFDGQPAPLKAVIDPVQEQVVNAVVAEVEKNLGPLEENVVDIVLNRQLRPTPDSIKVRALQLELLPAAREQFGSALVDLQIGNAACGPSGRAALVSPPVKSPVASGLPKGVSAGYAEMPETAAKPDHDSSTSVLLGALAVVLVTGAGFGLLRRVR